MTALFRYVHSHLSVILSLALIGMSLVFNSCSEKDDAPLGDLVAALAELSTNSDGRVVSLDLDNGTSFRINNVITELTPDSAYRVSLLYMIDLDNRATLYNLQAVISPMAVDLKGGDNPHTDPLDIVAIRATKKYIDLTVDYQSGGEKHLWGFAQKDLEQFADGHQILNLELVHSQNGDALYYTRRRILSCPIYPFKTLLTSGRDSIRFSLNTFEGKRSFVFAAP